MHLLILGGGVFLGAALLDRALERGHQVTVFNRGRSRDAWPEGVEAVTGDRRSDLGRLAGRAFDAVVDTCGYVPADVAASAEALRDVPLYGFVSSISAYRSFAHEPIREGDPLAEFAALAPDDRDLAHYGAQKAACESALRAVHGERALVVRPGLIVGPGDRSGRFSYWPWRAMRGGAMLVPDLGDDEPLQFIDVRDLAAWMVRLLERGERGAFNATGPARAEPYAWSELVAACQDEAEARGAPPAEPVPVDEAFLLEAGVQPWTELPLWLPSTDRSHLGHSRVDLQRALATRLVTRPLAETIAAVLDEGVPAGDDPRRQGKLTPSREAELLRAWQDAAGAR